jgi:hypothetical protein
MSLQRKGINMRPKGLSVLVVFMVTLLCMPALALALQYGLSWSPEEKTFTIRGWKYTFDRVDAFIVPDGYIGNDTDTIDFEDPGIQILSGGEDWTSSLVHPDYTMASGPSTTAWFLDPFQFTLAFDQKGSDKIWIDILVWNTDTIKQTGKLRLTKDGDSWSNSWAVESGGDPSFYETASVPEPTTMLLLGSGLLGLGIFGRKRYLRRSR